MTNNNFTESTIKVGTFFSGIGAPEKAYKVCAETYLYHQAGNSIVVDVIYNVLKSIFA